MTAIAPGGYGPSTTNQGLPAYGSSKNLYLPSRNVYNFKASNTYKTRGSIARAQSGGLANWAFFGDSLSKGFNGVGTTSDGQKSWPEQLKNFLVASGTGITNGGTGTRPISISTAGNADTNITGFTGGFTGVGQNWVLTTSGGTFTYVSPVAGTVVEICWFDAPTTNAWSFTVDGGAANNVAITGTNLWKKTTIGGFANTVHTVVVTSGTLGLFKSIAVNQTTGLLCHNVSYGGATLGNGVDWFSLSNFAGTNSLGLNTAAALPAALDAVFIEAGTNDMNNLPLATTIAGYSAIKAQSPFNTGDLFIVAAWRNPTTTDAQWNAYMGACYQTADTLGCPLIDWNDRVGGATQAIANGLLGPDNVHGTYGMYSGFGKAVGDLLLD